MKKNYLFLSFVLLFQAQAQAQRAFKAENIERFKKPRAQERAERPQPALLRKPAPVTAVRIPTPQESRTRFRDTQTFRRFMDQLRIFTNPESNLATKTASASNVLRLTHRLNTESFIKNAQENLAHHNLNAAKLEQFTQTNRAYKRFERLLKRYLSQKKRTEEPSASAEAQDRLKKIKQDIKKTYDKNLSGQHKTHAEQLLKERNIELRD